MARPGTGRCLDGRKGAAKRLWTVLWRCSAGDHGHKGGEEETEFYQKRLRAGGQIGGLCTGDHRFDPGGEQALAGFHHGQQFRGRQRTADLLCGDR